MITKRKKPAPNGYTRGGPLGLLCLKCGRDIHPLGSASHRAMHNRLGDYKPLMKIGHENDKT
jgi:hypothetical protein